MLSESAEATARTPDEGLNQRVGAKRGHPHGLGREANDTVCYLDIGKAKPSLSPLIPAVLLRAFDLLAIGLPGIVAYLLYVYPNESGLNGSYVTVVLLAIAVGGVLLHGMGVYAEERIFSRDSWLGRVIAAWAILCAVFLACAFALKISDSFSRVWSVTWFLSSCAFLIIGRLVFYRWLARAVQEGRFALATVIVGAGEHGQRLAAYLDQRGDPRTRILGFIDDRRTRHAPSANGYKVIGDTNDLIRLIRRGMIDDVFIALPLQAAARMQELVDRLAVTPVRVCLAPDLTGAHFTRWRLTQIAGLPMFRAQDRPLSGWACTAKAIEDFVLAVLLLVLLAPLLAVIAIAIKLDSPGPVFFKQPRYGFNNQLFNLWKFRTMHVEATDEHCEVQTTKDDPRVTRVGRFLRRSSLDELPQLINVLRGEMSIVGPRPHAVLTKAEGRLFEEIVDKYAARHRVKPGITGLAQVNGWRGETDTAEKIQKRVEYDLQYIDNWVIWLDIKILLKTIAVVFRDDKAY